MRPVDSETKAESPQEVLSSVCHAGHRRSGLRSQASFNTLNLLLNHNQGQVREVADGPCLVMSKTLSRCLHTWAPGFMGSAVVMGRPWPSPFVAHGETVGLSLNRSLGSLSRAGAQFRCREAAPSGREARAGNP